MKLLPTATYRLAGSVLASLAFAAAAAASPQQLAIPAYFYPAYPDPLWAQMEGAAPVVSFAVMNPANGAGAAPDPNYVSQVAATRAAGVKVLGYVYSSYAARDAALLEADIDHYYSWYGVDGIFIDEADNQCASQPYYAALDSYVKAKGGPGFTVINPGTVTPECFVTAADVILNFEGSFSQYQSYAPLGWESGYDPSHFWHLVYATGTSDVASAVLLSQARGAGYVYVTPDTLPNPWDSLPGEPYWSTELAYVQPTAGDCTTPVVAAKLQISGVDTVEADDKLKFSGRFTLAGDVTVDPVANGLRLVVGDGAGAKVDVTLAAGAYAGTSGWTVRGSKWTWRDDGVSPPGGIDKALVKKKFDGVSSLVSVRIGGKRSVYPVSVSELPLDGVVLLKPDQPTTECATASFTAASPTCTVTGGGSTIRCK